jgi:hypothetical protein
MLAPKRTLGALLAWVYVGARHVLFSNVRGHALPVTWEQVTQAAWTDKEVLGLRRERHRGSPIDLGQQRPVDEGDSHRPRSSAPQPTIRSDILRQDFRSYFHGGLLRVGDLADPVLLGVRVFADGFEQFGIGGQYHTVSEVQRRGVSSRVGERHIDFQVAEVWAPVALRDPQRFCM